MKVARVTVMAMNQGLMKGVELGVSSGRRSGGAGEAKRAG
jgi:hypothetical protein